MEVRHIHSLQRKIDAKRKQKSGSNAECNGNGAYSSENITPEITTLEDTLKSLLPVFITLQKLFQLVRN